MVPGCGCSAMPADLWIEASDHKKTRQQAGFFYGLFGVFLQAGKIGSQIQNILIGQGFCHTGHYRVSTISFTEIS